jgi:hypothetical protein
VEAWLSIYETRLRAKRPEASLAAQWIGEASRSSVALMMQNGQNEVETTHGGIGAWGLIGGFGGFGGLGCKIMDTAGIF